MNYIIFEKTKIFADPMGIIPKVRYTQKNYIIIKKYFKVSCKQFGANGVGLRVKRSSGCPFCITSPSEL